MKHHDSPADQRAEEDPPDAFSTLEPQFKQTVPKGLGVRRAEVRANRRHAAGQENVSSRDGVRELEDCGLHVFAVVLDRVVHDVMITNVLYPRECREAPLGRRAGVSDTAALTLLDARVKTDSDLRVRRELLILEMCGQARNEFAKLADLNYGV